ncbi:TIGR04222 domain-containing membrane protein [Streptomyces syringium]|uniref:TIGR04222 domain-containing membrane protein n=1 Tax=Streptomyces syringium TaxID=76729 RepID=UPI003D8D8656
MIIALTVALIALAISSAWLLRLRLTARGPRVPLTTGCEPGLLEIAYLKGREGGVADTVIARMYAEERISVDSAGKVEVISPIARDSFERAVLKECATDWSSDLRAVRDVLTGCRDMRTLEGSLEKQGLLMPLQAHGTWRRSAGIHVVWLVIAGILALASAFTADSALARFAPLALVALGIVLRVLCRPRVGRFTDHGARMDDYLWLESPWGEHKPDRHPAGLAGVVAAWGPQDLPEPDKEFGKQLEKAGGGWRRYKPSSSRSSGSGSSSSSSSYGCSTGCSSSSCSSSSCSSSSCSSSSSSCGGSSCS